MVQAIQVFKTTDGEVFPEEALALQHQAEIDNQAEIDAFIDKHFPIGDLEPVLNEDKTPKMKDGNPVMRHKPNNARGPARKAVLAWLAEHPAATLESTEAA